MPLVPTQHDTLTEQVISAALAIHSALGPGLLEGAYEAFLARELELRGIRVHRQVPLAVRYRGVEVPIAYRIDLLVEDEVIVELKTVAKLLPVHEAQVLSYLRLGGFAVGLLINFHVPSLKDGIRRLLNVR